MQSMKYNIMELIVKKKIEDFRFKMSLFVSHFPCKVLVSVFVLIFKLADNKQTMSLFSLYEQYKSLFY